MRWSRPLAGDPLTHVAALGRHIRNWRAMLRLGLEAGDLTPEGEAIVEAIEARLSTGRPLATDEWIAAQERATQRHLTRRKPDPKAGGSEGLRS